MPRQSRPASANALSDNIHEAADLDAEIFEIQLATAIHSIHLLGLTVEESAEAYGVDPQELFDALARSNGKV